MHYMKDPHHAHESGARHIDEHERRKAAVHTEAILAEDGICADGLRAWRRIPHCIEAAYVYAGDSVAESEETTRHGRSVWRSQIMRMKLTLWRNPRFRVP